MNNTTRKSFIKTLFATTALAASGAAFSLPPQENLRIRDDLHYVFGRGPIHTSLLRGDKMREFLRNNLSPYPPSLIEKKMGLGDFYLDSYKVYENDPNAKRVESLTLTEDWLRRFCADNGIC